MATAAFNTWNAKPNKSVVILCEIEAKEELSVMVQTGSSSTYRISVPTFISNANFYREVTGVTSDGVELTEAASSSDVVPNAGTWYFEPEPSIPAVLNTMVLGDSLGLIGDGTLYVHLPDGSNPTSKDSVYMTYKLRFGSRGMVLDGYYYEPRLTSDGLPTLHEELEDLLFGVIKNVGSGNINLSNADGAFDSLTTTVTWKNSKVTLKYGGEDLSYADYEDIGVFLIEDFTPAFDKVSMLVRDGQKRTLRLMPSTPMIKTHVANDGTDADADFPNMDANKDGTFMPIVYGDVDNMEPIRINGTGDTGTDNTYLCADYNVQALYAIDSVYNGGVEIDSQYLQLSPSGCTFSITSGYTESIGQVTADVRGVPASSQPWETSADYLKYGGEIIADMYTRFAGFTASGLSTSSFTAADVEEPAQHSLIMQGSQRTLRTYIKDVERGILGRTVRTRSGLLELSLWAPSADLATSIAITSPDVAIFEPDLRIESIFSRVIVRYGNDPTANSWKVVQRDDDKARYLHLDGDHVERVIETTLKNSGDAIALAERVRYLSRNPQLHITIKETGTRLLSVVPGERISISVPRAPSATSSWTSQIMEVLAVTKQFNPPSVTILLNNMNGISGDSGVWVDNLWNVWLYASEDEKTNAGWWLNDSNFAQVDDSESENVSIYW